MVCLEGDSEVYIKKNIHSGYFTNHLKNDLSVRGNCMEFLTLE
jgi:hypothetical protein